MRKHADVADYSVRVEASILAHFTYTDYDGPAYGWELVGASWVQTEGPLAGMVKLTDNLYISLRGYNADVALADAVGTRLSYGDFSGLMQLSFGFDGVQYTSFDPPFPIGGAN